MTLVAGGLVGAAFFLWIAGLRIINPTEYGWVMQADWRIHFLGWHFFRREPWQWPPGVVEGYFHAPNGTAIGFTDSIPLAAFLLKPLSPLLPETFQYLGIWLLLCFILQGVFAVLLIRLWTTRGSHLVLAAALFVLVPTLLIRVGHPALCAHWLILWALWLYFRESPGRAGDLWSHAALGAIAGLVHPYLAVMVFALLLALAVKNRHFVALVSAAVAITAAWWAAGLFTGTSSESLATEGLGNYSLNLLAPITSSGWSALLPELPIASPGQSYEGFHYLGAGLLALLAVAVVVALQWASLDSRAPAHDKRALPWGTVAPLALVSLLFAFYALSPRVTAGDRVLLDFSSPLLDRLAVFRATGRFFWPMAYLLLVSALAIVVTRLRQRTAAMVLGLAVLLQVIDLREAHAQRRETSRSDAFHGHQLRLRSPLWTRVLPHYRHLVLVNPPQCGQAPVSFEWPAYLAGLYGLSINAGEVARPDHDETLRYCQSLFAEVRAGHVRDDTVYLLLPSLVEPFRAAALHPLVCVDADSVPLCTTERSAQAWRVPAVPSPSSAFPPG